MTNPQASSPNGPAGETITDHEFEGVPSIDMTVRCKRCRKEYGIHMTDAWWLAKTKVALAETARERDEAREQIRVNSVISLRTALSHESRANQAESALTAAEEKIAEMERALRELVRVENVHPDEIDEQWEREHNAAWEAARAALPPHTDTET